MSTKPPRGRGANALLASDPTLLALKKKLKRPTYPLDVVKAEVLARKEHCFTLSSLDTIADKLLLQVSEAIELIQLLTVDDHFYKTMEAEKIPGAFQDVYHLPIDDSTTLYIKVQLVEGRSEVVISFKRKD
jgi:hypothetical protein